MQQTLGDEADEVQEQLALGRALQAQNQQLREQLARLGQLPSNLQGSLAAARKTGPAQALSSRTPSVQAVQDARALLQHRYQVASHELRPETTATSHLASLLRKRLELNLCQERTAELETLREELRQELQQASAAARHAEDEAQRWRRARRDLLRGKAEPTVDEPLQQLKAVLERKRTEVGLIRLRAVSADQWPGALCKLKRLLGSCLDESLLRDVLLRWFHIALWDTRRRAPDDGVGQEADTLDEESAATPLAKIEVAPQALLASQESLNGTRVTLVATVDSQVWRTEGGLVSHGKSVWPASSHFIFEVFSWKSALEVQVLASSPTASSASEVGSSRLEVLALIPNRWHRLKETLWGGTSRPQIEVGIYVSIEPPSSRPGAEPLGEVQAVEADSMPQPTQRELQKMKLQELLHDPEERSAEKESKPHRDGKSQRELQREELERLLSDGGPPTEEQRKKDRIRSLEAKIAEMQAELEAERSSERAKSDVRQKRDQKRLGRQANPNMGKGLEKLRAAAKRVDDTAETARTFENFGLNFEVTDLFGFMQDSKEDGSSEEYNIYGDSDNDERLAKRQQEAQDIIAKEKERMDGGAFLRMRRGAAPGGGARERAARKRGKKDAAKVKEEPVKQASQEPEPPRSEPEPSTFNFGFNFGMPEVLNFGGQDAEEISEEHYIYDESDTEAQLERRRAEAKDILALEQERTAGAVSRMRRGVAPAPAGGGARERAAKKKNKKLAGTAMMTASQGLEEA